MSSLASTTELPLSSTSLFVGRCPPERVGCARIIGPGEYVSLGIAAMAWTFHMAMCFFIAWQIVAARNQTFSSAFYKLYVVLSVMEILHALPVRRSCPTCGIENTNRHRFSKYHTDCTFAHTRRGCIVQRMKAQTL